MQYAIPIPWAVLFGTKALAASRPDVYVYVCKHPCDLIRCRFRWHGGSGVWLIVGKEESCCGILYHFRVTDMGNDILAEMGTKTLVIV